MCDHDMGSVQEWHFAEGMADDQLWEEVTARTEALASWNKLAWTSPISKGDATGKDITPESPSTSTLPSFSEMHHNDHPYAVYCLPPPNATNPSTTLNSTATAASLGINLGQSPYTHEPAPNVGTLPPEPIHGLMPTHTLPNSLLSNLSGPHSLPHSQFGPGYSSSQNDLTVDSMLNGLMAVDDDGFLEINGRPLPLLPSNEWIRNNGLIGKARQITDRKYDPVLRTFQSHEGTRHLCQDVDSWSSASPTNAITKMKVVNAQELVKNLKTHVLPTTDTKTLVAACLAYVAFKIVGSTLLKESQLALLATDPTTKTEAVHILNLIRQRPRPRGRPRKDIESIVPPAPPKITAVKKIKKKKHGANNLMDDVSIESNMSNENVRRTGFTRPGTDLTQQGGNRVPVISTAVFPPPERTKSDVRERSPQRKRRRY